MPSLFSFPGKSFQSSPTLPTLAKHLSPVVLSQFCAVKPGRVQGSQDGLCALGRFLLLFLACLGHAMLQQEDVGDAETGEEMSHGWSGSQCTPLLSGEPHPVGGCSRRQRPETKSCHEGTLYTSGCVEGASPKGLHPHHSIYMYDSPKKGQKSDQWSPGAGIGELEEARGNVG